MSENRSPIQKTRQIRARRRRLLCGFVPYRM